MHLKTLGNREHNPKQWGIAFHDEFHAEFQAWTEEVQDALLSQTPKLRLFGPALGRPTVDTLKGSLYSNMKELRFEAEGGVWRVAFAFDPKRRAILLCGGSKTGLSRERFYGILIHTADRRYGTHLAKLAREQRENDNLT